MAVQEAEENAESQDEDAENLVYYLCYFVEYKMMSLIGLHSFVVFGPKNEITKLQISQGWVSFAQV